MKIHMEDNGSLADHACGQVGHSAADIASPRPAYYRFGAVTARQERQKIHFMTDGSLRRAAGMLKYLKDDVILDGEVKIEVIRALNFLWDAINTEARAYKLAVDKFNEEDKAKKGKKHHGKQD